MCRLPDTTQRTPKESRHMMKQLDTTAHLYSPTKAEQVAAQLQAGDMDWTYTVVHDPQGTGYSYIMITDEDGAMVGKY